MKKVFSLLFIAFFSYPIFAQKPLPAAQRMQWWHEAKMGLFIHWGPVSLIGSEISWSREKYGKSKYDSLYLRFNPNKYNAREWVALAKAGGMKYIVLTAKHHDGFCLWNTKTIEYNIMNTPFGRDVCKELVEAAHEADMPIGWYYSVADWKDPDCRNAESNNKYTERALAQIKELLTNYGKISLLWIDFEGGPSPIEPKKVYDMALKLQPEIIVNNRLEPFTGIESHSRLGQYGDYATPEGFVAGYGSIPWETCTNMGHQWAWKFNDTPRSLKESVQTLLRCVGGNGNLLFNIGPDSSGVFPSNFIARATEMGDWLNRHSEAIYKTAGGVYTPAKTYISSGKGKTLYLHLLSSSSEKIHLPPMPAKIKSMTLINGEKIHFEQNKEHINIQIPADKQDSIATIIRLKLDQNVAKIAKIKPFSTSHSLAYDKKASASSASGQFLHDASAAFDDNMSTDWKMGRRKEANFDQYYGKNVHYRDKVVQDLFENTGWLEVDLGEPKLVGKITIEEAVYRNSEINNFEVKYEKNGDWILLAKGNKIGKNWSETSIPIMAQKFRLYIQGSTGFAGIKEFQLFSPE